MSDGTCKSIRGFLFFGRHLFGSPERWEGLDSVVYPNDAIICVRCGKFVNDIQHELVSAEARAVAKLKRAEAELLKLRQARSTDEGTSAAPSESSENPPPEGSGRE